ncbi:hypothetical protein LXL04_019309 [Taraxacum kok-saghyz]
MRILRTEEQIWATYSILSQINFLSPERCRPPNIYNHIPYESKSRALRGRNDAWLKIAKEIHRIAFKMCEDGNWKNQEKTLTIENRKSKRKLQYVSNLSSKTETSIPINPINERNQKKIGGDGGEQSEYRLGDKGALAVSNGCGARSALVWCIVRLCKKRMGHMPPMGALTVHIWYEAWRLNNESLINKVRVYRNLRNNRTEK